MSYHYYLHRTICDVLEELRKAYETRNFSYMSGLVEELQSMGNSLEAALYNQKDFERAEKHYKQLKSKIKKLEAKLDDVEEES